MAKIATTEYPIQQIQLPKIYTRGSITMAAGPFPGILFPCKNRAIVAKVILMDVVIILIIMDSNQLPDCHHYSTPTNATITAPALLN